MKKVISIMLVISMMLSFVTVAVAAPEANILESTNIVNITGKFSGEIGTIITILLVDEQGNIKYITEAEVGDDYTYRVKFLYEGEDMKSLKLRVKQGAEDITDTVVSAIIEKDPISYSVNVTNANGKTVVNTEVENFYNMPGKTFTIMTAYYGENNNLLNVFIEDTKDVEFEITTSSAENSIPEGTKNVKVFAWENEKTMIPLANEISVKPNTEEISVLMIGNSFVDDSIAYLKAIAAADGVDLYAVKAVYGGGGFKEHWACWDAPFVEQDDAIWNDINNNLKIGTTKFKKRYNGTPKQGGGIYGEEFIENMTEFQDTIDTIIGKRDHWDYVVLQTLDGVRNPDNYAGSDDDIAGQNMAKYIREKLPDTEIVIFHTWAYEKGAIGNVFPEYGGGIGLARDFDQEKMWQGVSSINQHNLKTWATLETDSGLPVAKDGKPIKYIPAGQAFNNARENPMFDTTYIYCSEPDESKRVFVDSSKVRTLHRDSYHCSWHYGRYLLGLVWYGCLTGNSVINNNYKNAEYPITELESMILKKAAQKAIDDTGLWN